MCLDVAFVLYLFDRLCVWMSFLFCSVIRCRFYFVFIWPFMCLDVAFVLYLFDRLCVWVFLFDRLCDWMLVLLWASFCFIVYRFRLGGGGGGGWPFMCLDVVFVWTFMYLDVLFLLVCLWPSMCWDVVFSFGLSLTVYVLGCCFWFWFVFDRLCVGMLFLVLVCLTVYVFGCCFCSRFCFISFCLTVYVLWFVVVVVCSWFSLVFAVLPFQHRTHTQFPSRLRLCA